MDSVKLELGNIIAFVDLNGVEAMQSEQVQQLEELMTTCKESMNQGTEIIADAVWDRLMEILRKVAPDSELCKYIWEDSVDELEEDDDLFVQNPMYSIMTVKSFDCDEILQYQKRLPDALIFDSHISVKLNGHGIRLKFKDGHFVQARSRARASAGRDITAQLKVVLENGGVDYLADLAHIPFLEIRGEWVMPFENMDIARSFNPDIKSAFSAVSSMGRASATEEEWGLLRFVAYEIIADGLSFDTKEEEYSFLEAQGFEVPLYWVVNDLSKETLIEELRNIVSECEQEVKPDENGENGYHYYTDGLVFTINDVNLFRSIGDDGTHYKFGNMALKVGYWKQDMYSGYVQTIMWMRGKTKVTPVAIVAEEQDIIEFTDLGDHDYVIDKSIIQNYEVLGVLTAGGNRVRRVPLYEPANIAVLDAYKGGILHFRYGGEAGVVPCFEDGTPLIEGRVGKLLTSDTTGFEGGFMYDDEEEYVVW